MKRRNRGFSLIELMIVIVVMGILAAVAFPNYTEYVRRGYRTEAQSHMMDIAGRQGQYLIDARAYAGSLSELSVSTPTNVAKHYTITLEANAGPPLAFTVTAAPKGDQTKDKCGTMTLNQSGAKTAATGSCW